MVCSLTDMTFPTTLRLSTPNQASSRPWSSMHHGATLVPMTNTYAVDAVAAAFYACFTTKKRPPQRLGRSLT